MKSCIKPGIFIVLVLLLCFFSEREAASAGMTDVRVGLAALYSGKESIQIMNNSIGFGYCINDSYTCEISLSGTGGFIFTPATGYFYVLKQKFSKYEEAKAAAEEIKAIGADAYPAVLYRGVYTVYVGGNKDKAKVQQLFARIKGQLGFSYETISEDNGHRILVSSSKETLLIDAKPYGCYPQFKAVTTNSSGIAAMNLGSRSYRGRIEIGRYGKATLTAVNILNVEVYLYSVVACEMPSNWQEEALKAQAVCARSYALTKTGYSADSSLTKAYTLEDTVNTQVYKGIAYETESTKAVVNATLGETVQYNGSTIMAFFYSTSGGKTEDGYNVWGLTQSYYSSVTDLYETEPERAPWTMTMTKLQLTEKLQDFGFQIGTVKALAAQITTASGRIYSLKVSGSNGNAVLQTNTIRDILGLASTKFKMITNTEVPDQVTVRTVQTQGSLRISECYVLDGSGEIKPADSDTGQFIVQSGDNLTNFPVNAPSSADTYLFAGMGYGHGVGLSQSGAKGMAEAGFTYTEIIEYYYKGATIGNYR